MFKFIFFVTNLPLIALFSFSVQILLLIKIKNQHINLQLMFLLVLARLKCDYLYKYFNYFLSTFYLLPTDIYYQIAHIFTNKKNPYT